MRTVLISLLFACLLAVACQLGQPPPTLPEPRSTTPAPTPEPGTPGPTPTPILGAPGPAPTATPSSSPEPTPEPSAPPGASGCGSPIPPDLSRIEVKVHIKGPNAWTLDSTPLVGPNREYCAKIGFTDGRSFCPVRAEGHPERVACEAYVTGRAKDTGRPGPTWYFEGRFCTGQASGCDNSPENQYQLLVYRGGTFQACAQSGVCGEVFADR
jgi:hypothetical protein